ncbi:MAG TPA: glycosyltransferase [Vicinamibacterales bacterium]|nr:glycosyltransferase [Vicinamibacterales bacterium]
MPAANSIRVLRVITRLNIGGPSIQAIELSTRLAARGYRTLLAHGTLDSGEGDMRYLLDADRASGVEIVEVPALKRPVSPADDLRAMNALRRIIDAFRPAIIHTHMAKAGALARLAAIAWNRTRPRAERARLVHTYHGHVLEGYFGGLKSRGFLVIERALARATDRIVAISPRIRDELLRQHRIGTAAQYRVVPLGFDLEPFLAIDAAARADARDRLGLGPSADVVSTVGRLTAIKDQRLFLQVARRVARQRADAVFLIAGDGELRADLEQLAHQLGIASRVRFLGWRRDLTAVYAATNVFLLTSRNEGTPVAIIESLASGTPAVSTDVGGVRDVISEAAFGALAPLDDVDGLSDRVVEWLENTERQRAAGAAARVAMRARFAIDRLLDDVAALYHELRE